MAGVHRLFFSYIRSFLSFFPPLIFSHVCSSNLFFIAGGMPRLVLSILVLPQSVFFPNRTHIPSTLASPCPIHRPVLTRSHPPPSQRYIAFGTGYPHHCNALSAAGAGCPALPSAPLLCTGRRIGHNHTSHSTQVLMPRTITPFGGSRSSRTGHRLVYM